MLVKQKIKYIQSLGQKKFRDAESLFIAEGPKIVDEMLNSSAIVIKEIFAIKDWFSKNPLLPGHIEITEVSDTELEKISQLVTPNMVLAIIQKLDSISLEPASGTITLALDTIQDPGNLGTIIRIADWFGVKQIICSPECADLYSPKVIQSTMGSITRIKVCYDDLEKWILDQKDAALYITALDGQDIRTMDKISGGIIVIGNESKGVSKKLSGISHKKITIPGRGGAESLNAAVATGIILSHIT